MLSVTESKVNIHITEVARLHFVELIKKEEEPDMALRIFLDRPGVPTAEIGITFCPPGDNRAGDIRIPFDDFVLFVDKASAPYLQEAKVDYQHDTFGGQLAITAPGLRGNKPETTAPLKQKIEFILNTEVNPNLASHGGMVSLVEIRDNNIVVLRFGGGCHGCGMVDVTLKQGIEKSIKDQLPEVEAVVDVTDHSSGENPYY